MCQWGECGACGPFRGRSFSAMPKVADKNKAHYEHLMVWSGNGIGKGEGRLSEFASSEDEKYKHGTPSRRSEGGCACTHARARRAAQRAQRLSYI